MPAFPVAIARIAALPAVTDPLWRRILSPAELSRHGGRRRAAEHLAARAMARLAVGAALGWPHEPPWHDIAVHSESSGRPRLVLSGGLAEWQLDAGLLAPDVSLSHAAGHAAALAWLPDRDCEATT